MTFFEAAIEVLRQAGRPLHYKKIAEFAMRDDLLSHMGKNPDATMAQRLTQEIKSQGESVIVETRPGVYGLRESEVERINEEAEQRLKREEARRKRREEAKGQEIEGDEDEEKSEDEQPKRRRNRRRSNRSKKSSGSSSSRKSSSRGSSVSDESSDDDASEKKSSRRKSSRRKSSRRKSSRSRSSKSEPNGNAIPVDAENISDEKLDTIVNGNLITDSAPAPSGGRRRARGAARRQLPKPSISKRRSTAKKSVTPVEEAAPVADVVAETPEKTSKRSSDSTSSVRESRRKRSRSRRSARSSKSQSTRSQSSRSQKRSESAPQSAPASTRHLKSGPVRLDGIAQAAYTVLQDGEKRAYKIADLADEIFERKLVKFHTHDASATVQAALANDNQIRQKRGHRPLFSLNSDSKWGLSEWGLPAAAIQKEQTILSLSEEIRQATLGDLGEALLGVKNEALEHIALTLLERLSYQNIKVSKRSSSGDVYFTADWRQGLSDVRVCIQVTLEAADELGADAVTAIRETLHHYSAAEGVIIHLGDITRDAITESRQDAKAPITLIDRKTFVELLIRHGIGVQTYTTPILMVDTEFIETLKS